jgi:flagellar biosynthesis chaperone FliJ
MNSIIYPLKQVLDIKRRRVEEAEKILKEKKELLAKEEEKLKNVEAVRDKVLAHQQDKLQQLRVESSHPTTSPKVQQMKIYLKVVAEKLQIEEKKVKDQKDQVKIAQKKVEEAKQELDRKRLEVDKLKTHQEDWTKERAKELEIIEAREQDELGSTMFLGRMQSTKASKQ